MRSHRPTLYLFAALGAVLLSDVATAAPPRVPAGWSLAGRVQTVRGPIDPERLGETLTHEHLFTDFLLPMDRAGYRRSGAIPIEAARFMQRFGVLVVPQTPEQLRFWDQDRIDLPMIARMRAGFLGAASDSVGGYLNRTDPVLDSESDAIAEANGFREVGGGTIVDVTLDEIGRNPRGLVKVSEVTGVNVVMGTGWYRWPFRDDATRAMSVDQLAQRMVDDVVHGARDTGIKSGIIGEIPLDATGVEITGELLPYSELIRRRAAQLARANAPGARAEDVFHPDEIKVLRAAARASRATGAAVTLHHWSTTIDTLNVLEAEGADLSRVIVGHGDAILMDPEARKAFLARGVTIGIDYSLQFFAPQGPVSPAQKLVLNALVDAIREGHADRLLISHDLCRGLGLKKNGGSGLTWVHEYVLPYLRSKGVSDDDVRRIMVGNPKRLLTFVAPRS